MISQATQTQGGHLNAIKAPPSWCDTPTVVPSNSFAPTTGTVTSPGRARASQMLLALKSPGKISVASVRHCDRSRAVGQQIASVPVEQLETFVQKAWCDPSTAVRCSAALALGERVKNLHPREASTREKQALIVELARRQLAVETKLAVRLALAAACGSCHHRDVAAADNVLIELAADLDAKMRSIACEGLARRATPEACSALLKRLVIEHNDAVLIVMLRGLIGRYGSSLDALQSLLNGGEGLSSQTTGERFTVPAKWAMPASFFTLFDCWSKRPNPELRAAVAGVVCRVNNAPKDLLERFVCDDDESVLREIVEGFTCLQPHTQHALAAFAMQSVNERVRRVAALCLAVSEGAHVVDSLGQLSQDPEANVRSTAEHSLLCHLSGVPSLSLYALLNHQQGSVRYAAARTLCSWTADANQIDSLLARVDPLDRDVRTWQPGTGELLAALQQRVPRRLQSVLDSWVADVLQQDPTSLEMTLRSVPLAALAPLSRRIEKHVRARFPVALAQMASGQFDSHVAPLRIAAYLQLLTEGHRYKFLHLHPRFSYFDWENLLKQGPASPPPIEHVAESRFLAYEAYELQRQVLDRALKIAKSRGKQLFVVANVTYGGTAVTPLPIKELQQNPNVRVTFTKIGSTSGYEKELATLFSPDDLRFIVHNQPLIVVIDGSPNSTPRAAYGYHQFITLLNAGMGLELPSKDGHDPTATALRESPGEAGAVAQDLYAHVAGLRAERQSEQMHAEPYTFASLSLDGRTTSYEVGAGGRAWETLSGPVMLFVQATMPHELIANTHSPAARYTLARTRGTEHQSAYFDDRPEQDPQLSVDARGGHLEPLALEPPSREHFAKLNALSANTR